MQFDFDFDFEDEGVVPIEGVAVLYCYDSDGEPTVMYGAYGDPSTLVAIGLYTVALDEAKRLFASGAEYDEQ